MTFVSLSELLLHKTDSGSSIIHSTHFLKIIHLLKILYRKNDGQDDDVGDLAQKGILQTTAVCFCLLHAPG